MRERGRYSRRGAFPHRRLRRPTARTVLHRDEAVIRADMRAAAIVKALRAEGVRQPQIVELSMGVVGGRELGRLGRIELPPGLENGEVDQAP